MDASIILNFISNKLYVLPGLLIAITLHELAHGYSAFLLGDPTAKNNGRLTLNPFAHIDIVGFLLLFTVGFGWAKPVPIDPRYFKNRKIGTIIVSLAGPITNFTIAVLGVIIIGVTISFNRGMSEVVFDIVQMTIWYNVILGIFNLLPFPPLDGSKIVASILPIKIEILFYRYEKYLYSILLLLIISNTIDRILGPLINISFKFINNLLYLFLV